jgi:DNA-directed RNA polymerase specialized sigma24 family protein
MHDARDAEDKRLLEDGEHELLLAGYFHTVRERCCLRLRDGDAGDEAAQRVFERLASELSRGRVYGVPYRVVVHMVTEWTLRGFYPGAKVDDSLPEGWDPEAPDAYAGVDERLDIAALFEGLAPGQREVVELVYVEGLSQEQTAERLGIRPNAVYQRLHNAHARLAEKLRA